MGRRGKSVAKPATPQRLPPKGQTGKPLRTPHHLADPYGQFDTLEVEDIVVERLAKKKRKCFSNALRHTLVVLEMH